PHEAYYDELFAEINDYFRATEYKMPLRTGYVVHQASLRTLKEMTWTKKVVETFNGLSQYASPADHIMKRSSTPLDANRIENISFKESDDSNGNECEKTDRPDQTAEVMS